MYGNINGKKGHEKKDEDPSEEFDDMGSGLKSDMKNNLGSHRDVSSTRLTLRP